MLKEKPPSEVNCLESLIGLVVFAAIIWLFVLVMDRCGSDVEQKPNDPSYYASEAFYVAQTFVKRKLIFPESAVFESSSKRDNAVKVISGSHYRVTSFVESKNRLGLPVRFMYTCTIKRIVNKKGYEWELVDIHMTEL